MPEKILNGDFSLGFQYWTNPTGGGAAFTLDEGKAKAISNPASASGVEHSMLQVFSNNNYVLSARIWVWGQWSVPSGNISNGSCQFKVRLAYPVGQSATLVDVTKTPSTGSGWLLENYDILDKFGNYGNFTFKLDCTPASAKDDNSAGLSHPYTSWSKAYTSGNPVPTYYDSDNKVMFTSKSGSGVPCTAWVYKSFVVGGATYDSRITVKAKGYRMYDNGQADGKVILVKPDTSEVTLWSGSLYDDNWQTALNNLDITSHIQSVGTYTLKLWSQVASSRQAPEEPWEISEFHFDDLSLVANWYSYTQAMGWFDNISIILLCRYYKVVKEDLGSGEIKTMKAMLSEKEDAALGESFSSIKFKPGSASEALALIETFTKKVLKTVKEDLGVSESYFVPDFFKSADEALGLSETYQTQRRVPKTAKEDIGLRERLWARLTRGNIVIDYDLTTKTEWEDAPGVTTPWVKTKTIVS